MAPDARVTPTRDAIASEPKAVAVPTRDGPPTSNPVPTDTARPRSSSLARGAGELAIYVRPWAMIWIDGKPAGQTPFAEKLPAGSHTIRIANEDAGKDETIPVTITADQKITIRRTW
jgi:serine/threonine-protein kinase